MIGHESGAAFWIVFLSGGVVIELARLALRGLLRREPITAACELCGARGGRLRWYRPTATERRLARIEDGVEVLACSWCTGHPDLTPSP